MKNPKLIRLTLAALKLSVLATLTLQSNHQALAQGQTADTSQLSNMIYKQVYSLEDLKVLEAQQSYREFLDHAHDIRPSERNQIWSKMVGHMAESHLKQLMKLKDYSPASFQYVEKLALWPSLLADDFFLLKREQYALAYFQHCFLENNQANNHDTADIVSTNTNDEISFGQSTPQSFSPVKSSKLCRQQLQAFWQGPRQNPETGVKLAQLLQLQGDNPQSLWQFYRPGALHTLGEFFCKQEHMQLAVWGQLKQVASSDDEPAKLEAQLKKTMHPDCWKQLVPGLKQSLLFSSRQTQVQEAELAYQLLKQQNQITQAEEDLYFTLFILKGPVVGKSFNLAWATLKQIGQDHKRRERLMNSMKQLDPLPDGLFGTADLEKRHTLMSFISKHFPEYLDFYGKSCLAYLEGTRNYAHGNPTLHCQEFFSFSDKEKWIAQPLKLRYSGLQKQLKGNK